MKRKGREMRAAGWRRSIARCSGRYAGRSERAGVDAAVDQEILAGDVARLHAAQIGAELAEFLGRAEEFGELCAYLCSVQAGYITGQNFLIDGGIYPGTF